MKPGHAIPGDKNGTSGYIPCLVLSIGFLRRNIGFLIIGFLRRNLNTCAVSIKQQAYFSLVRPLLEYSSNVWDPHTHKNIKKLEMVQRRAARYVLHRRRNTSSVTYMLQTLNWPGLESRRKDMRLCMMFKIDRGLVAISKDSRLIQQKRPTRHSHSRAFQTITYGTEKRRMSFFPRTVRDWNALPPDIPYLETLEAFKASVSRLTY